METSEVKETYSTDETAELVGVTYRQLDYWLRQGIIVIGANTRGSGTHRRFTHVEVAKLKAFVATYSEALGILESFSSGRLWAALDEDESVWSPD